MPPNATPSISLWLPRHFVFKFSLLVCTKVFFLFYSSWLEVLQAHSSDNQWFFSLANSSSHVWYTSQLKGRWFQVSIFRSGSCYYFSPLCSIQGNQSLASARESEQPFRAAQSWLLLKELYSRRKKCFCIRGRLSEELVFTRRRPIEPTWGVLQDAWISLTLSLETRSMSQARMPGFLPAHLLCHGAVSPENLLAPAPARAGKAPRSPGRSSESYGIWLLQGLVVWPEAGASATLSSLISEELPHTLPVGERYREVCTSKSLGVHGEAKERKMGYLTGDFPGGQNSHYVLPPA